MAKTTKETKVMANVVLNTKETVTFTPTVTDLEQRKELAELAMKNAITIGTKKLAWVPVKLLNIKPYQRSKQSHIMKIAEEWNDSKCNVLLVSYDEENGCFNVMDGQHRGCAARMRGIKFLVCEVFTGMTISKEATYFVNQNENTKKLTPFDTYKANQFITGEDETEQSKMDKKIAEICKKYDIKVEKSNARNTLRSVTEARTIMRRDGVDGMEFVLDIIFDSHWNEFTDGFSGDLMNALGKVYCYRKLSVDVLKERLCDFLVKSSPSELIALGNNNYPNLGRRARLDAILAEIINEPIENKAQNITRVGA